MHINEFFLKSSINNWKVFFKFHISFRNFGQKTKNIQKNIEYWRIEYLYIQKKKIERKRKYSKEYKAWLLIKVKCIIYQWIWLDKLYKLMWSFFQISESFFELVEFFQNNSGVRFTQPRRGGICAEQNAF